MFCSRQIVRVQNRVGSVFLFDKRACRFRFAAPADVEAMNWTATGEIPPCTNEQIALYVDALVATCDELEWIDLAWKEQFKAAKAQLVETLKAKPHTGANSR